MLTRLDHLVILVSDLEGAVRDYEGLGFGVTPGGEHADGLTRNALVPFRDGTYLELVAFVDPDDPKDNVWGWRDFSPEEGLIDYCAASDALYEDVERFRNLGLEVDGPHDGGRRLPHGGEILWRSASFRQRGRVLPFLIEDLTPRDRRVPGGPAASHPNGAMGIARLEVSIPGSNGVSENLAALTGTDPERPHLGACQLVLVEGNREGPSAVHLSTARPAGARQLDRTLARGVRFTLAPDTEARR